jgi:hypothetical protein
MTFMAGIVTRLAASRDTSAAIAPSASRSGPLWEKSHAMRRAERGCAGGAERVRAERSGIILRGRLAAPWLAERLSPIEDGTLFPQDD